METSLLQLVLESLMALELLVEVRMLQMNG
jgi:hypothetical protein